MEFIIVFSTGIFALWIFFYSYEMNSNKIEQNIIEYEQKEKAKQQKSKVLVKRKKTRTKNKKENINVYDSSRM